jgi:hypothetical protein
MRRSGYIYLLSAITGCSEELTTSSTVAPSLIASLPVCSAGDCALSGTSFLRESSLPLCEWGDPERGYQQFVFSSWTCNLGTIENGSWNDRCTFDAAQQRPTNAHYQLMVRNPNVVPWGDLQWPDGTALHDNFWGMGCERTADGTGRDRVQWNIVAGALGPDDCNLFFPLGPTSPLVEVDGGTVEHVRPAAVRGQVMISGAPIDGFFPGQPHVVVVAVQWFDGHAWVDSATTSHSVNFQQQLFEVETVLPPGTDVRLQVRGTPICYGDFTTYDIRAARIQVETCIPDQSDPGSCL